MENIHLAIVGGRDFHDYGRFTDIVDRYILELGEGVPASIVSGGAAGVDTMAARYARENGYELTELRPDWRLGRGAGLARNGDIVVASTHVLALPTASSRGTHDTIRKARAAGKKVTVVGV